MASRERHAARVERPTPLWLDYGRAACVISSSQSHAPYLVERRPDGTWTCRTRGDGPGEALVPCPGRQYRGTCAHIKAVVADLPADVPPPPSPAMCYGCGEYPIGPCAVLCARCLAMERPSTPEDVALSRAISEEIRAGLAVSAADQWAIEANRAAASAHEFIGGTTEVRLSRPTPWERATA